jgi:hypothetical protein
MNTTISISLETKKALDKRGNKGDTYDEIIQELLK